MSKLGFIKNKYTVSALILISLLGVDILLHRGISRVIIPSSFTDQIKPINILPCRQTLNIKEKHWYKAIDNISLLEKIPAVSEGIECDVYFDTAKKSFFVYHDSTALSDLNADSLLAVYRSKKLQSHIWFDFKNLQLHNHEASLTEMLRLQKKYNLQQKLIIESGNAALLKSFCDSGFYTSYYVPFFNPYLAGEKELVAFIRNIEKEISTYPTSAISGYYFQYPILKRFFPNYPILTWIDNPGPSLVAHYFNRQLNNDSMVKVILSPLSE
jgi:hypothetical protein